MRRISNSLVSKAVQSLVPNRAQPVVSSLKAVRHMQDLKNKCLYDQNFVARTQYFYQVKQYSRQRYYEEMEEEARVDFRGRRRLMPKPILTERKWKSPLYWRKGG